MKQKIIEIKTLIKGEIVNCWLLKEVDLDTSYDTQTVKHTRSCSCRWFCSR